MRKGAITCRLEEPMCTLSERGGARGVGNWHVGHGNRTSRANPDGAQSTDKQFAEEPEPGARSARLADLYAKLGRLAEAMRMAKPAPRIDLAWLLAERADRCPAQGHDGAAVDRRT